MFYLFPDTSRAPRDGEKHGQGYFFMEREVMEEEIRNEKFLEHGEYNGNLYGTKIETILEVINSSKMCVLDVNPTVRDFDKESTRYHPSILEHLLSHVPGCLWLVTMGYE